MPTCASLDFCWVNQIGAANGCGNETKCSKEYCNATKGLRHHKTVAMLPSTWENRRKSGTFPIVASMQEHCVIIENY